MADWSKIFETMSRSHRKHSTCSGPGQTPGTQCGRLSAYANGLCLAHYKQMERIGKLRPLRLTPLVRLPGTTLRVTPALKDIVSARAQAEQISNTEAVRRIIIEWAAWRANGKQSS